jgi:hypothetical protein
MMVVVGVESHGVIRAVMLVLWGEPLITASYSWFLLLHYSAVQAHGSGPLGQSSPLTECSPKCSPAPIFLVEVSATYTAEAPENCARLPE